MIVDIEHRNSTNYAFKMIYAFLGALTCSIIFKKRGKTLNPFARIRIKYLRFIWYKTSF